MQHTQNDGKIKQKETKKRVIAKYEKQQKRKINKW